MARGILSLCILFVGALPAADRLTLTGTVTDATGKPLEHATVMVYHAGVKQGYSTFCPSCYSDCGKRTLTGADGRFTISSLSPDLYFELVVVHDGYLPAFVKKVDPAKAAATAVLHAREAVTDPRRVVLGVVVDANDRPVRDAVVQPQGIQGEMPDGRPGAIYGTIGGLDAVAVTNEKGEFELAHAKPFEAMVLQVEARGKSPKIATNLATGTERHSITVTDGALIRGRLVQDGKAVPNAEVGLVARQRGWAANLKLVGYPLPEVRIGTNEDGTFAITNVPPGVEWYVYGKMESLAARGGAPVVECATKRDGEEIDLGDLSIAPALRLRGKVVLSDGEPIPAGMRITITSDRAFDSQTAMLGGDGSFEFSGLAKGGYTMFTSVRGYSMPRPVPLALDSDVSDYVLRIEPR
jgi:protocatechuate 3,4-dioxygenase beta subunit